MSQARALLTQQQIVAATVASVMVLLGGVLYSSLPDQMAVHWNAAGGADGTTTKLIAILLMPAFVVGMSVLFEITNVDDNDRVIGSIAMLLLLVVQIMIFLINLGVNVPIVSFALVGAFVVVSLAVWYEVRYTG
jgi:uncharacterized membrane protein